MTAAPAPTASPAAPKSPSERMLPIIERLRFFANRVRMIEEVKVDGALADAWGENAEADFRVLRAAADLVEHMVIVGLDCKVHGIDLPKGLSAAIRQLLAAHDAPIQGRETHGDKAA